LITVKISFGVFIKSKREGFFCVNYKVKYKVKESDKQPLKKIFLLLAKYILEMKQFITLFSACITLIFLSSCSATKSVTQSSSHKKRLEFINNVAITNDGSAVELEQKKQVYQPKKIAIEDNEEEEEETDESSIEIIQNKTLADFIKDWYGVPYQYGGECKKGIDCSAFVQELYEDVYHIHLLRTAQQQFATSGHVRKWERLKEGDLVFFKIHSRHISHVGVYLGDGKFVHASFSSGVMISDLTDRYWTKYYAGGGRIQG
jgi:lipoprotein Spr